MTESRRCQALEKHHISSAKFLYSLHLRFVAVFKVPGTGFQGAARPNQPGPGLCLC